MTMSKEKQIEEMAFILDGCCNNLPDSWCETYACSTCKAEQIYNAGYRKQSDVIDEFAKVLKEKMKDLSRMEYNFVPYFLVSKSFIDKIAEQMKGGAE